MKFRALALVAVLPALLLATPATEAAPVTAVPTAAPTVVRAPAAMKPISKLEVKNAAAVPGEKRTLEATLTAGANPLAGKVVTFRIEGKDGTTVPGGGIDCGSDTTDATGKAKLQFTLPELAQGAYRLKARFAGDDAATASSDEGNLGMIKGITRFEMSDLIWGTYKNEPGPKSGSLIIKLIRQADGTALSKSFKITVNGQTWQVGGSSVGGVVAIPLTQPTQAGNTWNVKVQFEGDPANQASAAERTYTKPAN